MWTHSRSELKGLLQYEKLYDIPEETNLWLQLFKGMNNKITRHLWCVVLPPINLQNIIHFMHNKSLLLKCRTDD